MSDKLILQCSDVNVSKVSDSDGFRWWLRLYNGECEFYEIVASDERGFRFGEVHDCFDMVDDE